MINDADKKILHNGDRVYTYDIDGSRIYGELTKGDETDITEWYVKYDDGEDCAVLDFSQIWKA